MAKRQSKRKQSKRAENPQPPGNKAPWVERSTPKADDLRRWIAGQLPKLRHVADVLADADLPLASVGPDIEDLRQFFGSVIDPARSIRRNVRSAHRMVSPLGDKAAQTRPIRNPWAELLSGADVHLAGLCEALDELLKACSGGRQSLPANAANELRRLTNALAAWPDRPQQTQRTPTGNGDGKGPKQRGGSKPQYNAQEDAALARDWGSAHASGSTMKEFARAKGREYKNVKRALERHRKRRN